MTRIDLVLIPGDTFRPRLTLLRDGAAADLTGCILALIVKRDAYVDDLDADLDFLVDDGLTIDAPAGTVDPEFTDEATAALSTAYPYTWRLLVQEADGAVFVACGGDLVLAPCFSAPVAISYTAPAAALEIYSASIATIPPVSTSDTFVTGAGDTMVSGAGDTFTPGS